MEVIESSAAVKEMSVEAAAAAVLSEMDGIWALKKNKEQKCRLSLVETWLKSQKFVEHYGKRHPLRQ